MKKSLPKLFSLLILMNLHTICKAKIGLLAEVHPLAETDSVTILGHRYKVPDFWTIRKIDTKLEAEAI